MKKYRIVIFASMEFEINAMDEGDANNIATLQVEQNRDDFDWYFDQISEVEKQ